MKRQQFGVLLSFIIILLLSISVHAQPAGNWGFGMNLGSMWLIDDDNGYFSPGFAVDGVAKYEFPENNWSAVAGLGFGQLKGLGASNTIQLSVKGQYAFSQMNSITPFAYGGLGVFSFKLPDIVNLAFNADSRYFDFQFIMGGGIEYKFSPDIGINFSLGYHYTTGDDFDGINNRPNILFGNDSFLDSRIGVMYYLPVKENITPPEFETDTELLAILPEEDTNQVENLSDYSLEEFNALQERLRLLRSEIDEQQQTADNFRMLLVERQTTLAEMEKAMANAAENKKSMPSFTGSLPGATAAASAEYQRGLGLFYERQYDAAIMVFTELLNQGDAGPLESNCHYWIGECNYGKRQYQEALRSFEYVLNYEISPKIDDALLMGGKCMLNLGDVDGARGKFRQLQQEFPDSEFSPKADRYLSRM